MDTVNNDFPGRRSDEEEWEAILRNRQEMTSPPGVDIKKLIDLASDAYWDVERLLNRIISDVHYEETRPRNFRDRFRDRRVVKNFAERRVHIATCERCRERLQTVVDRIERVLHPRKRDNVS